MGELGIYLVDHQTGQRVDNPPAGTQVEVRASFVAEGIPLGTVVRVQRKTVNGSMYTEVSAPESWGGRQAVERNLFTWTVPPENAWISITLDPRERVTESDESDNARTLTLSPTGYAPPSIGVPAYRSLPSARHGLYLDFDGNYHALFAGSRDVTTPAYDTDGDPLSLSSGEREDIRRIWARVAEDFSPFNIDVTTESPPPGRYDRWQRVAIGGASTDWYEFAAAGTAMVGSFIHSNAADPAFVFTEQSNGDGSTFRYPLVTVADAAAHEAAHTFGLLHQTEWSGTLKVNEYNPGHGDWGPLMGKSGRPISTWYDGATSDSPIAYQDDMAILADPANGFGWRPDEAGDTSATATPQGTYTGVLGTRGVIARNDDVDVYSATLPAGRYRIAADVDAEAPNLDAVLELRDGIGNVLAVSDPADAQSASIEVTLPAGTYWVGVRSTGVYGWVGQYELSIAGPATPAQPLPPPPPSAGEPDPTPTPGPAVDLAADVTGTLPVAVTTGAKGATTVAVRNDGDVATRGPAVVRVYVSADAALDDADVLIGQATVARKMAPGAARGAKVKLAYPATLSDGDYHLIARVEPAGGEPESSSGNNVGASDRTVRVVAPFVRLAGDVLPPRGTVPDRKWAASVVVRNDGNARFAGAVTVRLYASTDEVLGDDDVLLATSTARLGLGAGSARSIKVPVRPSVEAGEYHLFAVVTPVAGGEPLVRAGARARFA